MTTFLKSRFEAVSTTKSASQPLSQFIRKVDQGTNGGQLLVTVVAVPGASSYELRWSPHGTGGTQSVLPRRLELERPHQACGR